MIATMDQINRAQHKCTARDCFTKQYIATHGNAVQYSAARAVLLPAVTCAALQQRSALQWGQYLPRRNMLYKTIWLSAGAF